MSEPAPNRPELPPAIARFLGDGPAGRRGAIFDLDGVVTRTARVHFAAWKRLFDAFLAERWDAAPFTKEDYHRYVDGLPRYDGVATFLRARGIYLPRGTPSDPPEAETICGLGNRKNIHFREALQRDGVDVYRSTVTLIERLHADGFGTALVSSSRNARAVLEAAGLTRLFDVILDGSDAAAEGLGGKPAPDIFLAAAARLGVEPARAFVVEDATSGVAAARAGGFGLVMGVDRAGQARALREAGADIVVPDLAATEDMPRPFPSNPDDLRRLLAERRPAVFLDYDGTLTPIVARPDLAVLSDDMRRAVQRLAGLCPVAIVSGRDRADVERLVGLDGLIYAGSHGFDIAGPDGLRIEHDKGAAFSAAVGRAAERLTAGLADIGGALVEPKRFAVAVHYRQVAEADVRKVERVVDDVIAAVPELKKTHGKKVFELRPRFDWDKGKAVLWLLDALDLDRPEVLPIYVGDDETDEDAFRALTARGSGIVVADHDRPSAARYRLETVEDVGHLLDALAETLELRDG
ncbi:trehalose-phosphatase [Tranquillimonas alkanivorans]|uniref:Trehalose 6-phosphate phosphatase n=1 Tax=Tranquillimonas alkanivorans TaxID=441119 RepID=A0A1I5UTQ8_9RHOB|nr:trehalose-phosphatase [Tranquillimonas alkanivorans]SFP98568.1 trehalose 6-phosphatase [Tranquillimonas alkanivorans]